MTTPLAIVATSGWVSEIVGIVQNPAPGSTPYVIDAIVGAGELLEDIAGRLSVPLLAGIDQTDPTTDLAFAVGDKTLHQDYATEALKRSQISATLVHQDATLGPWVTLGAGCIVAAGARLTGNVTLGEHCHINTGAILSHDDRLGDFVTVSPSATLCGNVQVGSRASIFASATVLPGVHVGADAIVGAGALVNRDVAPATKVAGVPAREF